MRTVHGNRIRAKRTVVDGIRFDSMSEAAHYSQLKLLEMAREISGLVCHPKYPIDIAGQHVCTVIADFRFFDNRENRWRVTDVKGCDTALSKLKRKLVHATHGVEIEVVRA